MFNLRQAGMKKSKPVLTPWMDNQLVMEVEGAMFHFSKALCEKLEIEADKEVTLVNKDGKSYLWVTSFQREGNKIIDSEGQFSMSINFVRVQKSNSSKPFAKQGRNKILAEKCAGIWRLEMDDTGYFLKEYVEVVEEVAISPNDDLDNPLLDSVNELMEQETEAMSIREEIKARSL